MENQKEREGKTSYDVKGRDCQWKVPGQCPREGYTKHDSSSTSSFFSGSNFTMSCSGADEQEEIEPSTSGCSSFVAHSQRNSKKEKKKARVQEYLKELKALVKPTSKSGAQWKMGTLSTLEHVLSSMKKIKEAKARHHDRKGPGAKEEAPYTDATSDMMHPVYESDSHESLASASLKSSDELRVILSGTHSVEAVSGNLQYVAGYPKDCWIGRSFVEFLHKKDATTFRSACKQERESENSQDDKVDSKIFYLRLRKFKSLGMSGFSLRKQDQYVAFQCTASRKRLTAKELDQSKHQVMPTWYEDVSISAHSSSPDTSDHGRDASSPSQDMELESSDRDHRKLYTILYCVPLTTPYSDSSLLPDVKTFETRHTLFCSYCHIQPDTISLLGYLPQEMIGVSIFDFYHNDDLNTIYKVYQKVIALRGVPFKSGPIRILAKNGSYVKCSVEWSSFVNPWSNRLEFIVSKHTVVKGPENTDVFSENYQLPSLEEVPELVVQTRQKIKDLLMQPVQAEYMCNSPERKKRKGKTVNIIEKKEESDIYSDREPVSQTSDPSKVYVADREHGKGLYIKEASISRTYEQLNYTNCIKKFLLGQPRTFSSDSDVKKSSSEDGFDCEDAKETVPADADFDFDINVPKPPSFGSSTKVLVSEQEHRDLENEPVSLRETLQLQPASQDTLAPPFSPPPPLPAAPAAQQAPPAQMNLTRDLLLKHTIMQEQLYVATASPERSMLFGNESRDGDSSEVNTKRQNLKRIHSPDRPSSDRCKSGRHTDAGGQFTSILNPSFPLIELDKVEEDMNPSTSPNSSSRLPVPLHLYPVTSLCKSSTSSPTMSMSQEDESMQTTSVQHWPYYQMPGVNPQQQVMPGFHRPAQPSVTGLGFPIPVYQMNSYMMQQASMMMPKVARQPRKKAERAKSKAHVQPSSWESSSTEDTSSSLYLLESSVSNMKMAYNEMVLQSMAQQQCWGRGLKPAPWLEGVALTEGMQLRYHVARPKRNRQLKKDREALEKMQQPALVLEQLDQQFEDIANPSQLFLDEDQDVILQRETEDGQPPPECSCMRNLCCRNRQYEDHGITEAICTWRRNEKKEKRGRKVTNPKPAPDDTHHTDDNMDVDSDTERAVSPVQNTGNKTKTESCSSKSGDSVEGETFMRCDVSSDSIQSLNTSDVTPSDQRSNNENGSSMKESDGDAMSKKSDSSSSDKQQTSESESDSKILLPNAKFEKLFGSLAICFAHMHKENAPWLIDVDFTEDIQFRYMAETKDKESTLEMDREKLQMFSEQDTVKEQFQALIEDISLEKGLAGFKPALDDEGCKSGTAEGMANEASMVHVLTSFSEETLNSLFMNF